MAIKQEFRIEYSPSKTILWSLFGVVFALIFFLVSLLPILLLTHETVNSNNDIATKLVIYATPLITLPLAYMMFVLSLRHFRNWRLGRPLVVFTQSEVKGYTPLGRPKSLKWERVNFLFGQRRYKNFLLFDKIQDEAFAVKLIATLLPGWNPKAVSIPLIYGQTKYQKLQDKFFDLNPYAKERFQSQG